MVDYQIEMDDRYFRTHYSKQERVFEMNDTHSPSRGYALAFILGALGDGLLVAAATKANPKLMPRMMENMMTRMK